MKKALIATECCYYITTLLPAIFGVIYLAEAQDFKNSVYQLWIWCLISVILLLMQFVDHLIELFMYKNEGLTSQEILNKDFTKISSTSRIIMIVGFAMDIWGIYIYSKIVSILAIYPYHICVWFIIYMTFRLVVWLFVIITGLCLCFAYGLTQSLSR